MLFRSQDKTAGRTISKNYVTRDWLKSQFGKSCSGCGDCLSFEMVNNKIESNLTADRIDNELDHNLENIVPLCVSCNCAKSNR